MMWPVADTNANEDPARDGGVLTKLPRTRPQRSSARRAAARGATAAPARARKPANGKRAAKAPGAVAPAAEASANGAAAPDPSAKAKSRVRATRPAEATKRSSAPRRAATRKSRPPAHEEAAPRQGFECDGETSGSSIPPPGGAELVATAAEIVGELAKAGLSTGERLVKDVLSRLPLS
jgi:hypothetical protein